MERDSRGLASLLRRYAAGEGDVFAELYRRSAPAIRAVIVRRIGHDRWAEDLLQQTFVRIHQARGTCLRRELTDDGVLAWFKTIARNVACSHLRRVYCRPPEVASDPEDAIVDMPAEHDNAETRLLDAESRERAWRSVRRGLAELSPNLRSVVELHKLQGLSMAEVSRRLGISSVAARVRAHRAYAMLRGRCRGSRSGCERRSALEG